MEQLEKEILNLIRDDNFIKFSDIYSTYCPFEAMNASGYEIRHSNFIADILILAEDMDLEMLSYAHFL